MQIETATLLSNRPRSREAYSDRTSLMLAHMSNVAYVTDGNGAVSKPALQSALDGDFGEGALKVLQYRSNNDEHDGVEVDTQYFSAVHEAQETEKSFGVISFRGTKGMQDWRTNFRAGTKEVSSAFNSNVRKNTKLKFTKDFIKLLTQSAQT